MGYERTHSFQKKSSYTPQLRTQFSTRPFAAPVQMKPKEQQTPEELENEAFNQHKFEAFGLQLKEKSGTITPVEQERLGLLQAKADDFWTQRREKASRFGFDFSKVSVNPPGEHAAPQLQPMGRLGTQGESMGGQRSPLNSPQQSLASPLQAKLTIGQPGDKYEQEADRVASQVVEQIHAPATAQSTQGQAVQRQEEDKEKEEELQAKPEISVLQPMEEPKEEDIQAKSIQKRGAAIAGGEASTDLDTAINSARGGGQPLDAGLQRSMGQAMGADFSGVRVHTDAQSDQLNQSIQAKAFTTGQDVFFRQGAYDPESRGGQELIAHELTHVVQQNGGAVSRKPLPQPPLPQHPATEALSTSEGDRARKRGWNFLDSARPGSASGSVQAVVVQRKVVVDSMFTANTGILETYLKGLSGLQEMIQSIETHPLNQVMQVDVYIEGGVQNESSKAGSTIVTVVGGQVVEKTFYAVPMVKALSAAKDMLIKVKLNVSEEAYEQFEQNPDHDDPECTGEMIATLLHETYLHVIPKMDHMVTLKRRYFGENIALDFNAESLNTNLKELQVAMTHVMGAENTEAAQHESVSNWDKVLQQVEKIYKQLTQGNHKPQWDLAYETVMSAVNDVMTHTVPEPQALNLPNLTPNMSMENKDWLYNRADALANIVKELYSQKFPDSSSEDEEYMDEVIQDENK